MRAIFRSASASSSVSCSSQPIAAATRVSQSSIPGEHNCTVSVPRALWFRAPAALIHHAAVAVAVVGASALLALAAASAPLLRSGAESEALKSKLATLSPLAAGLTIDARPAPLADDTERRAAIERIAASIPDTRRPIVTASTTASIPTEGNPLEIIPMSRDGATAHVKRLAGNGNGAWIAQRDAKLLGLRPGSTLTLTTPGKRPVHVRIGGVYLQLDQDIDNPYWVNFIARIRAYGVDPPPLPTFLLVDRAELFRIAHAAGGGIVKSTFEIPVEPSAMTPAKAQRLERRFTRVRRDLRGAGLGCPCSATTALAAAARLASLSVAALTPLIGLLAGFAAAIAVGAALTAGAFGARRRAGEASLSVAHGELRVAFATRAALEAAVPSLLGATVGLVVALAAVAAFTPDGTVDRSTTLEAIVAGAAAALAAAAAVGVGAALVRGPLLRREHGRRFVPPWELLPLAAAGIVLWIVETGGGLTSNDAVGAHPRLVVLSLPLLVAAGAGGLIVRALRRPLRRARPRVAPLFLAVRRLAAARSLLVLLTVTGSVAISAFAFAEILDATLRSSTAEKAYVANGADVQGIVDPTQALPRPLPYPAARVTEDFDDARIEGSSNSLELMSVRPAELKRVIHWQWEGDPRRSLDRLAESTAPLPAIANASAAHAKAIEFDGQRIPIQVVDVVRSFPGMVEGEDVLVVPAAKLERIVDRPYESATAYVWVKGPVDEVTRALERSTPAPTFITSVRHFLESADLDTASRTYGYLRLVAGGAAAVALLALLLYMRARARQQVVTSELLERMGMHSGGRAVASGIEAAALAAFACIVGIGAALLVAKPVATRVDPIAQYAPRAALDVPWATLVASGVAFVVIAGLAGALASITRADVAEAVRVA